MLITDGIINKIENEKYNLSKNEEKKVPYKNVDMAKLRVGDTVYVKSLDDNGTVLDVNDKKGFAWISIGNVRINAKKADIFFISQTSTTDKKATVSIKRDIYKAENEINVIGCNLDEAISKCEKFLDSAVLSNFEEVKIIHGKGLNVLSKGIQKLLKEHRRVESYRFGKYGEGEHGVTIVKLK